MPTTGTGSVGGRRYTHKNKERRNKTHKSRIAHQPL
jgi:hypothetical protein